MIYRKQVRRLPIVFVLAMLGLLLNASNFAFAQTTCPVTTVADTKGLMGKYPEQFELSEYETAGNCKLTFSDNPLFADAVKAGTLPRIEDRLPAEPMIVQPYAEIGSYGGTMFGAALEPESGTSEILSWHQVNLVRFDDDQRTIVPNVAKDYSVNKDFTEYTFTLRKGHKWSDGEPFTADDIVFWYNDLQLNTELNPQPRSEWVFGGKPMAVEKIDDLTVKFSFAVPAPIFLSFIASSFIEPFQPKHFLSQFHIKYNPDANKVAKERGLQDWTQLISLYYAPSDWKDVPSSPLLKGDTNIAPTLESHIRTLEAPTAREWTANTYYFAEDTAGNQLPYVNVLHEDFVAAEVQTLKIIKGEITLKAQDATFDNFPTYKDNESKGNYTTLLPAGESAGSQVCYGLNPTVPDPVLRKIFADIRFRQALSLAINRKEINELVYLGQGKPMQWLPVDHFTVDFVTDDMLNYMAAYDPDKANALLDEMGLTEKNSDGIRLRPDGKPLIMRVNYSLQGGPRQVHEIVRDEWNKIGVGLDLNELSSDELGSLLEKNEHAIGTWTADGTASISLANSARFAPPFNARDFGAGTAWYDWYSSKGTQGEEPPTDVKRLYEIQDTLRGVAVGTPEFQKLVTEAITIHQNNLFLIGVVGDVPKPIIKSNTLANFPEIKFYGPYWHMFPYRPYQFFIKQ